MNNQASSSKSLQFALAIACFLLILLCCSVALAGQGCNSTDVAIPDNNATGITSSVLIGPSSETIQDLNVSLDIDHDNVGDLSVSLKHQETGTVFNLINRPSNGTGSCTANDFTYILLDDEGTDGSVQDPVNCVDYPYNKAFTPSSPLSGFNGESFDGTWTLTVKDLSAGTIGTLRNFCVFSNSVDLEIESSVSANPVPGKSNFLISATVTNKGPFPAEKAGMVAAFPIAVAGADLVSAYTSKGSVGVSGLPVTAVIQAFFDDLAVDQSATVDIELESFGLPYIPLLPHALVRPNLPESLPFELFTFPVAYDQTTHPSGVSANVVQVVDGSDDSGTGSFNDACQPLTNAAAVNGNIALIDARFILAPPPMPLAAFPTPVCPFTTQITNAAAAGAVGIILATAFDVVYYPTSPPPFITTAPVPVAAISKTDHDRLLSSLSTSPPVNVSIVSDFQLQWWPITPLAMQVTLANSTNDIADHNSKNNAAFPIFAYSYDKDKDLAPDSIERCPDDPGKTLPGQCGCGSPDTDSDGDGIAICNDACPGDGNKITPGVCGCGVPDVDSDGDGFYDCKATEAFKALVQSAKSLVSQLTSSKKASKSVRDQLKDIKNQLLTTAKANAGSINTTSSDVDIVKLTKKAKKRLTKALKSGKKIFKKSKKGADKALDKLLAAIA